MRRRRMMRGPMRSPTARIRRIGREWRVGRIGRERRIGRVQLAAAMAFVTTIVVIVMVAIALAAVIVMVVMMPAHVDLLIKNLRRPVADASRTLLFGDPHRAALGDAHRGHDGLID